MIAAAFFLIILAQTAIIVRLLWDSTYRCWKRELLDLLWPFFKLAASKYTFVFADIDRLGQANANLGYEKVNQLVQSSLRSFWRSGDLALVFRYFSGDEFLVAVHGDKDAGVKVAERLQKAFAEQGLSITVGVNSFASQAIWLVQMAKPKTGPRPCEGQILV